MVSDQGTRKTATFPVIAGGRTVFMSVSRSNYLNERRAVVHVNAEKFLELWSANPYNTSEVRRLASGNPSIWRSDRKFAHAEDGFSHGYDNPVPLAEVGCWAQKHTDRPRRIFLGLFGSHSNSEERVIHCVGFTNGITRTIWLLANGCQEFPIECEIEGAKLLHKLVGVPNSPVQTVESLTSSPLIA